MLDNFDDALFLTLDDDDNGANPMSFVARETMDGSCAIEILPKLTFFVALDDDDNDDEDDDRCEHCPIGFPMGNDTDHDDGDDEDTYLRHLTLKRLIILDF